MNGVGHGDGGYVRCNVCEFRCPILEGGVGRCGMIMNEGGHLKEVFPQHFTFTFPVNSESIPLLHFYPNHLFLAVGSIGCNFTCVGCVSRTLTQHVKLATKLLRRRSLRDIIEEAIGLGCVGMAFILSEPTVTYWTFLRLAKLARREKLLVGCSSNLYLTMDALSRLTHHLDFVVAGIKGSSPGIYAKLSGGAGPAPVFRNIEFLVREGIHVEVTITYYKGLEGEVLHAAKAIANISPEIPFHIMVFTAPSEEYVGLEPSVDTAERLCRTVRREYLKYAYLFNIPGTKYLNTVVGEEEVIKREFFGPCSAKVTYFARNAERVASIKGRIARECPINAESFMLGYRVTGALELIDSVLRFLGVTDETVRYEALGKAIEQGFTDTIRDTLNNSPSPQELRGLMQAIAKLAGLNLSNHPKVLFIDRATKTIERLRASIVKPRKTYLCLGHPLYAKRRGSYQLELLRFIGSECINYLLSSSSTIGQNASTEELKHLSPEVIFIDAHFPYSVEDFMKLSEEIGLDLDAIKHHRVYKVPPTYRGFHYWLLQALFMATRTYSDVYPPSLLDDAGKCLLHSDCW